MTASLRFSSKEIIDKSGLKVSRSLDPAPFQDPGLPGPLEGRMDVDLDFSVGGSAILLQGRALGRWSLTCVRCLNPYSARFESRLEETYPLDQPEIDAEEEVRQGLFLALPPKPLCRADCKGLCQSCGADLNAGPCACAAK